MKMRAMKEVVQFLNRLETSGRLEPGQKEAADKVLKRLERAIRRHAWAKVKEEVGKLTLIFMRVTDNLLDDDTPDQ